MTAPKKAYRLEAYPSKGKWYWRIRCRQNGKIVSDGSESYSTKSNLRRALKRAAFLNRFEIEVVWLTHA